MFRRYESYERPQTSEEWKAVMSDLCDYTYIRLCNGWINKKSRYELQKDSIDLVNETLTRFLEDVTNEYLIDYESSPFVYMLIGRYLNSLISNFKRKKENVVDKVDIGDYLNYDNSTVIKIDSDSLYNAMTDFLKKNVVLSNVFRDLLNDTPLHECYIKYGKSSYYNYKKEILDIFIKYFKL